MAKINKTQKRVPGKKRGESNGKGKRENSKGVKMAYTQEGGRGFLEQKRS